MLHISSYERDLTNNAGIHVHVYINTHDVDIVHSYIHVHSQSLLRNDHELDILCILYTMNSCALLFVQA